MEEKVIVLSTPLGKMLEKHILTLDGAKKIKTVKQNTFFWMDNNKSAAENIKDAKAAITAKCGNALVYKIYPVFNGKVDLSQNKTDEEKMQDSYFTSGKKDITEEELKEFAAKNNLSA